MWGEIMSDLYSNEEVFQDTPESDNATEDEKLNDAHTAVEDVFENSEIEKEQDVAYPDNNQTTEEQLDFIADTAITVIKDILQYFSVGNITIDEYEGDEGELILDITGDDTAVLIGRHGSTLDSLQTIICVILNRKLGYRYPLVVDVEGYKSRHRAKLETIAHSSANRAAREQREIRLRPMTPYERRIIHMALRDDDRVETESEDEGPSRHVVVFPKE